MSTDYKAVLQEAMRNKQIAELRLLGTNSLHSASCLESNNELEQRLRAEIHALTDVILDNSSVIFMCVGKI